MASLFDQLEAAYGSCFVRSESHPSGLKTAMRLEPPPDIAVGYEDGFIISPECFVTVKRIEANRTFAEEERGLGRLVFLFHLGGQRIVGISGFGERCLGGPSFYGYYLPPGTMKKTTWIQGSCETVVAVGFWPQRLPRVIKDVLGSNSMLQTLNSEPNGDPIFLQSSLSLEMERAARDVLLPKVHRSLLSYFLMTKANELLCLGFDAVISALNPRASQSTELQSQIRRACQILEREIQNPPSVLELAQNVRLSAGTLVREFGNIYGVGIPEFLSHQRMKAAHHALVTTDLPLKKISYDVGYQHTSNFCTAFKRHFGRTPTEVRRASGQCVGLRA